MTTTDQVDVATLAAEFVGLDETRKHIVDRQSQIKSTLRDQLGTGKHPAGKLAVLITPQHRFSPSQAEEILPADLLAVITVPMVSRELAEKLLPPKLYEACQVEIGEARVTIR